MKEVILIRAKKESDWVSCQSIVNNLEQAYLNASDVKVISIINFDNGDDDFEIYELVSEIVEKKPSEIVFIDHKPHPANVITRLQSMAPNYLPTLTFHIFGDFVLQSFSWCAINSVLKNFNVNFVCASTKQKELINSFLNQCNCTSVIPFPVKETTFYYNESERNELRKSLGLRESDFLFLYTGRISLQKNVIELVKAMANCFNLVGEGLCFFFAGPFDDVGIPYRGQENPPGVYFQSWMKVSKTVDQARIKYIYNLEAHDLRKIYNAADCFISLSTHNDEDFGMSPAEALMCGLQLILSDWGGYSSFKTIEKKHCTLLPVGHHNMRILPDMLLVQKHIHKSLNKKMNNEERKYLSAIALNELSIKCVANKISTRAKSSESSLFPGFNSHFSTLSSIFKSNPEKPFKDPSGDYSKFYFETYRPYMKDTHND